MSENKLGEGKKGKAIAEIASGSLGTLIMGLSTLGNVMGKNPAGALISAGLLGSSLYGIKKGSDRLKGKGKRKPHKLLSHHVLPVKELKKQFKKHPQDKPINIKDFNIPKHLIDNLLMELNNLGGEGLKKIGKKISSKVKSARTKLKKFLKGETSYKPSDLLTHISTATGVISAFAPEFIVPSVIAQLGAKYAKSKGQGLSDIKRNMKPKAHGNKKDDMINFLKKHKKTALKILMGVSVALLSSGAMAFKKKFGGISPVSKDGKAIIKYLLSGSDKKLDLGSIVLHGWNVLQSGKGMEHKPNIHLAGHGKMEEGNDYVKDTEHPPINEPVGYGKKKNTMRFTKGMTNFIMKNPDNAWDIIREINKKHKAGEMNGSGKVVRTVKNILSTIGILGLVGAYQFARYYYNLKQNSDVSENRRFVNSVNFVIDKLDEDAGYTLLQAFRKLKGRGLKLAGDGLNPVGGKVKTFGNKQEVWKGLALKTRGGLTKKDLCINKKGKVVSRKQMILGQGRAKFLRKH
jgi:hypothetical protein